MQSFWTTAQLRAAGHSVRDIRGATQRGAMVAVRTGVLALPETPADLVRAVRVGGVATAHTAARALGLWTPPDEREAAFRRRPVAPLVLRVAVPSTTRLARLHDPDDAALPFVQGGQVHLFWTAAELLRPHLPTGRADLLTVLEHLFRCETPERALAVVESARHHRHLRGRDLQALAARLPSHLRPIVLGADERAESGIETIVRVRLARLGLQLVPQQWIDGVGRVDLLIEGRLIVECDGREWHDSDAAFERDRERDAAAAASRYRTLRFTWFQVLFRWPDVEAAVLAALAA